jgi:beta-galactosidase
MVSGPSIYGEIAKLMEERAVDDETGINTAMSALHEVMPLVMASPIVDENTAEAFSHLDVAGYNYMETRFTTDGELHPSRVIVATESHPSVMDSCWAAVVDNPHVIGDFTWVGWDYLGEAGVGRTVHRDEPIGPDEAGFLGPYPWLTAWCADIDITGHRRPQSYYREIVFGLRTDPYLAVHRPQHHGLPVRHSGPWSWSDAVASWSWDGHERAPVTVEVYADADEVELLVNGRSVGRAPTGAEHRFRAEFETTYEPGELEAVAWRGTEEVGRTSLRSASGPVRLELRVDRSEIGADPSDVAFVEVVLADASGTLHTTADRTVSITVEGDGVLQGFASGDPRGGLPFTGAEQRTFDGRALAVIRPTGPGTIVVTATAEACEPRRATITAR